MPGKTRVDPVFGLRTPLLFAHRGGVKEVTESTVKAFSHALREARADVLELDVRLTKDGEYVVSVERLDRLWSHSLNIHRPSEEEIFEIPDRCVDGIMTDRPKLLRGIIDKWQQMVMQETPTAFKGA